MTRQRAAVGALLERTDDFRSAQQLHETLREAGDAVGLATVYRTLAALAPQMMLAYDTDPKLMLPIIPLIRERMHTLGEAADYLPMFFTNEFDYTPDDFVAKKCTLEEASKALAEMRAIVDKADFNDAENAHKQMDEQSRAKAEELGMKLGPFLGPIRMAITGSKVSPPLMESMLVLGKDETLKRIDNAIKRVA